MNKSAVSTQTRVCHDEKLPYVETRARVISSPDGILPEGKVLVMKTPIFPPDAATDEEIRASTTMEVVDDEHRDNRIGHWQSWPPPKRKRSQRPGRNAPCPCGSGVKLKKCCRSEEKAANVQIKWLTI